MAEITIPITWFAGWTPSINGLVYIMKDDQFKFITNRKIKLKIRQDDFREIDLNRLVPVGQYRHRSWEIVPFPNDYFDIIAIGKEEDLIEAKLLF